MGLFSGLLGNASAIDEQKLERDFAELLASTERIEKAYQVIRDLFVFTNKRLILVDKQGLTGKKVEYHSIPYRSISHFAVETTGTFDLESELKIWISSAQVPIEKTFKNNRSIYDVQRALAEYVLG